MEFLNVLDEFNIIKNQLYSCNMQKMMLLFVILIMSSLFSYNYIKKHFNRKNKI